MRKKFKIKYRGINTKIKAKTKKEAELKFVAQLFKSCLTDLIVKKEIKIKEIT